MRDPTDPVSAVRLCWRTLAAAVAATLLFIGAIWIRSPPVYFTNDDVLIRLGIEGRLVPGQPPTGFMLFTNAALAWPLAWLHAATQLPLWDMVIIGTLVSGMATLLALCWNASGGGWLFGGMATTAVAVAALPLIGGVQFTISAAVAGGAAMAVGIAELMSGRPRRPVLLLAAVLLIAGELLRPTGAAAAAIGLGLMLAPFALCAPAGQRRRSLAVLAVAGICVVSIASVLLLVDRLAYKLDPSWDAYRQYHWTLVRLLEWSGGQAADQADAMRHAVGWSTNDLALLTRWLGVDPGLHGFDQIARADAAIWRPWWTRITERRLLSIVEFGHVRRLLLGSAPVLAAAATLAIVRGRSRHAAAIVAATLLFVLFCLAITVAFKELPFRLLAPLQLCLTVAAVVTIGVPRRIPPPLLSVLGLSLLLTLAVRQYGTVTARLAGGKQQALRVEEEMRTVARLAPTLMIEHADAFPAEIFWRPLVPPPVAPPMIRLDDNNQSPHLQRFLSDTGRQPLLRALCEDPSILIVSHPDRLEPITVYVREHFGMDVRWDEVFNGSFRVWRCTQQR